MIYMLISIVLQAWIIGSITLVIVRHDEKTGLYREALQSVSQYSSMHDFDRQFQRRLKSQLKLEFESKELSDEQVLQHFPSEVRRKVLRYIYLPPLLRTSLMHGIRQHFVDAFLTTCIVETFSPGEEIIQRGSAVSDLYLLVEGVVLMVPWIERSFDDTITEDVFRSSSAGVHTEYHGDMSILEMKAGDFINDVAFFTETPQVYTIRTNTICKTLTLSRSAYKMIADDHPGSVGIILQNLLAKVKKMATESSTPSNVVLPQRIEVLTAGSLYDYDPDATEENEACSNCVTAESEAALSSLQDIVILHVNKLKDSHTTRFLFAASRGDTATIALMCDQGFEPNDGDYDNRTAMMVASMKGNTDTVAKLLEYNANPNIMDMHGSTALYEAVTNGHDDIIDLLIQHGAELCMSEGIAATTLCKTVFDGNIVTLRRLLRAKIYIDAADYDKRTAAHIASAEGNVGVLKVLYEHGADLTLADRWGRTVYDEAKQASGNVMEYLESLPVTRKN